MLNEDKLITIPGIIDERGGLCFVEIGQALDFVIKRVYWLYDIQKERGGHAHKNLKQFIFCVHGEVDIVIDDGMRKKTLRLDSPNKGLLIDKPLWRDIVNFKNEACLVVLASDVYKEDDYIRSYEEFQKYVLG